MSGAEILAFLGADIVRLFNISVGIIEAAPVFCVKFI